MAYCEQVGVNRHGETLPVRATWYIRNSPISMRDAHDRPRPASRPPAPVDTVASGDAAVSAGSGERGGAGTRSAAVPALMRFGSLSALITRRP